MRAALKRCLSGLLAAVLCCAVLPAMAEGPTFFVPNMVSELRLPRQEELLEMSTSSTDGQIYISLSSDVDRLVAQWMGYFDQYEEIQVTDRQATASTAHHSYQLGASQQNGEYNTAFLAERGDWSFVLDRSGQVSTFWKNESGTDYFRSGLSGASGQVCWAHVGGPWYVEQVSESYSDGPIASVTAVYQHNGVLRHYFIEYRTAPNERYEIRYSAGDQPQYGWYWLRGSGGETKVSGFTGSLKHWINPENYQLLDSLSLIPFTSQFFLDPPRSSELHGVN